MSRLNIAQPRKNRILAIGQGKNYGRGRVFYSTFGHRDEMWLEAKWTMGMTEWDATPRPKPTQ